jgi:hypothetical protein
MPKFHHIDTLTGLMQGHPLSPLLFNLVADALSAMLDKAVDKHLIVGVLISVLDKVYLIYNTLMIL